MSFRSILRYWRDEIVKVEKRDPVMRRIMTRQCRWQEGEVRLWLHNYSLQHTMGGASQIARAYPIIQYARHNLAPRRDEQHIDFAVRSVDHLNRRVFDVSDRRGLSFASKVMALKYPDIVPMFDDLASSGLCACQSLYPAIASKIRRGWLDPLGSRPLQASKLDETRMYYRRYVELIYAIRRIESPLILALNGLDEASAVTPLRVIDRCLMQVARPRYLDK